MIFYFILSHARANVNKFSPCTKIFKRKFSFCAPFFEFHETKKAEKNHYLDTKLQIFLLSFLVKMTVFSKTP
jgi:hypothetical protein